MIRRSSGRHLDVRHHARKYPGDSSRSIRGLAGAAVGHRGEAPPARPGQTGCGCSSPTDGRDRAVRSRHLPLDRPLGSSTRSWSASALARARDHRHAPRRRDRHTAGVLAVGATGHLGRLRDRIFSIGGLAMPSFWIGLLMVLRRSRSSDGRHRWSSLAITEDPIANLSLR